MLNFIKSKRNIHKFALYFQVFIYFFLFIGKLIKVQSPIVQSDEAFYVTRAHEFWSKFNLDVLHFPVRPIFSWPSIIFIKSLGLNFNYSLIVLLNSLFYVFLMVFSLRYLFKVLKISEIFKFLILSTLFSMPLFFELNNSFMGDVAVTSWSVFFLACIHSSKFKPTFLKSFLLGFVFVAGFQIKPVFLSFGLTVLGAYVLSEIFKIYFEKNFENKSLKNKSLHILSFFTTAIITAKYLFPRDFLKLIHELYYNSTVNRYDVAADGFDIYFKSLWFPQSFLITVPLVTSIFLSFLFFYRGSHFLKFINNSFKNRNFTFLSNIESINFYSFIVLWSFFAFFVGYKDGRETFFLFPLFMLMISFFKNEKLKTSIIFTRIVTLIIFLNLCVVLSWSPKLSDSKISIFNNYFDLRNKNLISEKYTPLREDSNNFNSLKITEVLKALDDDFSLTTTDKKKIHVFLPHSSVKYNATVFGSGADFSFERYGVLAGINSKLNHKIVFSHGTFNLGAFYEFGGIPKFLFTAEYIILVKNHKGVLFPKSPGLEIYNELISKYLSEENSSFMDGLLPIHKAFNNEKEELIVYKRIRLPSNENFVKIVNSLVTKDINNMWNVPYIHASLLIDKNQSSLNDQIKVMSEDEFIKNVKYTYAAYDNKQQQETIRSILKHKKIDIDLKYPEFLNYFESN